ncbi:MAG: hypothetical protein EOP24_27745 [Hyphomicrobiales bacterium]|nr:MAG: hypothetical protein EOP24_27745 [Hyphomicrobiales bacterium]
MTKVVKPAAMREGRDIEWLVNWALEKQGLGRDFGGEVQGRSGDIPTGMRVDGGGYSNDGKWVHDDAEIIARQIDAMTKDKRTAAAAALLVHYGRVGTRPDWGVNGSGRWELVRRNDGSGAAKRRYLDQRKGTGLLGFEWQWVGHHCTDLDRLMLEWLAWWEALADLRKRINPMLTKFVATGPNVHQYPWDTDQHIVCLSGEVVGG